VPQHLSANEPANSAYQLITLRADGQSNTTIYNESDRLRCIYESRTVVLMNPADISKLGLKEGDRVTWKRKRMTTSIAGSPTCRSCPMISRGARSAATTSSATC
jgi:anaerobic selenocysteine-containing dehydrogenase